MKTFKCKVLNRRNIIVKTQQVINNISSKCVQDHTTSGSFLFLTWVVDEKYGLDQSEAASHTMRHELILPPFPFPFAFDQWKNSVTDEEESSERLRDPVHVTLITCCVFVIVIVNTSFISIMTSVLHGRYLCWFAGFPDQPLFPLTLMGSALATSS